MDETGQAAVFAVAMVGLALIYIFSMAAYSRGEESGDKDGYERGKSEGTQAANKGWFNVLRERGLADLEVYADWGEIKSRIIWLDDEKDEEDQDDEEGNEE
jgi:hypothetical protein